MRRRLDAELVRRGMVASPEQARDAIRDGRVIVGGGPALNAGMLVGPEEALDVLPPEPTFVSRGGEKLAAALERFGIDPEGRECLDAGASTGGFTDCLLQRDAFRVTAVDVGYGQLAWKLRTDPRVFVLDRTNVRALGPEDLPALPDLVVADLSYISLRLVVDALAGVASPGADVILLLKPQFEAERGSVERGGVVRDPLVRRRVMERVIAACESSTLAPQGLMASPLLGPAGNVEYLLHAVKGGEARRLDLEAAVREGRVLEGAE